MLTKNTIVIYHFLPKLIINKFSGRRNKLENYVKASLDIVQVLANDVLAESIARDDNEIEEDRFTFI